MATFICLILGYVLAYAIAFKAGRWKNLMLVLVIAPFFTSFLVRTLSWKLILADNGPVVGVLRNVHILGADGRLLATPVAVVAGLTYNFLPFMVLPLFASIDKIDHRLIEASGDLYANPFVGFFKVTWPLSLPGVVSGTLLTFIPAAGDYINAQLLGSPNQRMIGNVIQDLFTNANDYPAAGALSMILMIIIVVDGVVLRPPGRDGGAAEPMRWLRGHLVLILGLLVLVYTFIPIAVVVLMSFNQPKSRLVYRFDKFTLDNWLHPCSDPSMCHAVSRSIEIGLLATVVATVLGIADGLRAGPPRLRRPLDDEPHHLPADGLTRDRDGLLAAGALRRGRLRRAARVLDHPDRPHHVLHLVRGGHRQSPAGRARRHPRAGGDGPLRQPAADVLAGHLPAGVPRHPRRGPAQLLAVLRRLHHHQPERRHHRRRSRCTSGASPSAAYPCRSTSSAP